MKQVLLFVIISFFTVICLYSQTAALYETPKKTNVLFGIVSSDPGTFQKVLDFLKDDENVTIYSYCRKNCLIYAEIDLKMFGSQVSFAKVIESSFPGSSYYSKDCSEDGLNSYFRDCYEEIVKQY